ncbi:MAG: nucleotidyltransferase family protein [Dorea sp.]|nr:nucleotidyltransferase family protein [Dorea sp.]
MSIVGIIAEYNPFHNGHKYHIEQAKKLTGADAVVVVMSGDFVQRGTPAIMPKHLRTALALQNGADLVLELPVRFATGSAEFFSAGAVDILDALGCVDFLCFGAEDNDLSLLMKIAEIFLEEPEIYRQALQAALKKGASFPKAREQGLLAAMGNDPDTCVKALQAVQNPNNILAIEYLKELKRINSPIKPVPLLRMGAGYHDMKVHSGKHPSVATASSSGKDHVFVEQPLASASALRAILRRQPISSWKHLIPDNSLALLERLNEKDFPVWEEDFTLLMKYQLLNETEESLQKYADFGVELANRAKKSSGSFKDYHQFVDLLHTKNETYAHVSRALLHMLLKITKKDISSYNFSNQATNDHDASTSFAHYARILGFNHNSSWNMTEIKEKGRIPLITKLAQIEELYKTEVLTEAGKEMLEEDIYASNLYETVRTDKFGSKFTHEFQKQLEII